MLHQKFHYYIKDIIKRYNDLEEPLKISIKECIGSLFEDTTPDESDSLINTIYEGLYGRDYPNGFIDLELCDLEDEID